MGSTSSGKSSLLSQICGSIEFPSNCNLTTRCPTRLRMEKVYDCEDYAKISINWHLSSNYKENVEPEIIKDFTKIPNAI